MLVLTLIISALCSVTPAGRIFYPYLLDRIVGETAPYNDQMAVRSEIDGIGVDLASRCAREARNDHYEVFRSMHGMRMEIVYTETQIVVTVTMRSAFSDLLGEGEEYAAPDAQYQCIFEPVAGGLGFRNVSQHLIDS